MPGFLSTLSLDETKLYPIGGMSSENVFDDLPPPPKLTKNQDCTQKTSFATLDRKSVVNDGASHHLRR